MQTEDVLRHPTNADGWKHFDSEFSNFALEPRNVCLGLASDEFNMLGHMSILFNMWPVVLILYNLSP